VLVTFAAGILPLFVTTRGALEEAHTSTMCVVLARSKLDQLRSLAWTYRADPDGTLLPFADTTTNLASDPPSESGPGLRPSPPGSLWTSTAGYEDFSDDQGVLPIAGDGSPPPAARYARRWAVSTLAGDPDTLVFQVRVVPIGAAISRAAEPRPGPLRGETWLVTLETRTRP
jgi:hypothetical protein